MASPVAERESTLTPRSFRRTESSADTKEFQKDRKFRSRERIDAATKEIQKDRKFHRKRGWHSQ